MNEAPESRETRRIAGAALERSSDRSVVGDAKRPWWAPATEPEEEPSALSTPPPAPRAPETPRETASDAIPDPILDAASEALSDDVARAAATTQEAAPDPSDATAPSPLQPPYPAPAARASGFIRWWESRSGRRLRQLVSPVVIAAAALAALAAFPPTRDAAVSAGASFYHALLSRPELRIETVELIGAERVSERAVIDALGLGDDERAALAIDAKAARKRIEALGWVERARVSLRPPQTLEIEIRERRPAMLWRVNGALKLLDPLGVVVAEPASRQEWMGLPLIVGRGAEVELNEALALDRAARAAGLPIVGLTRIGERRWDLDLVDGPRILLPEKTPFAALERAARWVDQGDLMRRDVALIDLRVAHAPTLRRRPRLENGGFGAIPASTGAPSRS